VIEFEQRLRRTQVGTPNTQDGTKPSEPRPTQRRSSPRTGRAAYSEARRREREAAEAENAQRVKT
jgi:hypothetical protein